MAQGCALVSAVSTAKVRLTELLNVQTLGITVTAWIKATNVTTNSIRLFIWFPMTGGGAHYAFCGVEDSTYASQPFYIDTDRIAGFNPQTVFGPPPPTLNVWYGYAFVMKDGVSSGVRVYDTSVAQVGELLGTAATATNELTDYIELCTQPDFSLVFGSSVAQGRVWNRVLSEAEIETELASSSPVSTSSLISAFEDDPTSAVSGTNWTVSNVSISSADWPPNYGAPAAGPSLHVIRSGIRLN